MLYFNNNIYTFRLQDLDEMDNIISQFFCMIQESGSFGYKMKVFGTILFHALPVYFHCHLGEVVLAMVGEYYLLIVYFYK